MSWDPSPAAPGFCPVAAFPGIAHTVSFPMTFMPLITAAYPYPITRDPNMFAGRSRGPFIHHFDGPFADIHMGRTRRDESDTDEDR